MGLLFSFQHTPRSPPHPVTEDEPAHAVNAPSKREPDRDPERHLEAEWSLKSAAHFSNLILEGPGLRSLSREAPGRAGEAGPRGPHSGLLSRWPGHWGLASPEDGLSLA